MRIGKVVHPCNPSIQSVNAGKSGVQDQPWLLKTLPQERVKGGKGARKTNNRVDE